MRLRPSGLLIRAGLAVADFVARALPSRAAYGLADGLGRAWYWAAPARRRLVSANIARVVASSGRPVSGNELRRLVKDAFVAHARYYLEVLRLRPTTDRAAVAAILEVDDPDRLEALIRAGAVIGVSAHFGNFEPGALWLAARGLPWVAPVERIEPPELFEYLRSRRGAGNIGGELVAPPHAARRVLKALRSGKLVAIAGDREVVGSSQDVIFFGHPTRIPAGPASLAVQSGAPVVVGTLRRVAPNRFAARVDRVRWTPRGDRQRDVAILTQRIADVLAEHIAEAPEQWWGAFQPIWPDLAPGATDGR